MYCPRCYSQNVQVQATQGLEQRGCLSIFLIIILFCIPFIGWIVLLVVLLQGRESVTKYHAVCLYCGYHCNL